MKITKLNEHLVNAARSTNCREVLAKRMELMISNKIILDNIGVIADYNARHNQAGSLVMDLLVIREPETIHFNLVISPPIESEANCC